MAAIRLENISKNYHGQAVLRDISAEIPSGELIAVLGRSGVGKSTLLKIIAGLVAPDSGRIFFDDRSVDKEPAEKRGAVLVFQDYLLFPHLTVWQNVAFGLKMARQPSADIMVAVTEMLRLVQMEGYEQKYPEELSGGQRQRVALARALAIKPRVLLLDEPFSSLDPELRETTREFVRTLQRQVKITMLLVTHDWEEALMLSDRVAVVVDGRLTQYGVPEDIYFRPATLQVAKLLGTNKNYISGTVKQGIFHCPIGFFTVEGYGDGDYIAVLRAEQTEAILGENGQWQVTDSKFAAKHTLITVTGPGGMLTCLGKPGLQYPRGARITIAADFSEAPLFPDPDNVTVI